MISAPGAYSGAVLGPEWVAFHSTVRASGVLMLRSARSAYGVNLELPACNTSARNGTASGSPAFWTAIITYSRTSSLESERNNSIKSGKQWAAFSDSSEAMISAQAPRAFPVQSLLVSMLSARRVDNLCGYFLAAGRATSCGRRGCAWRIAG